MQSMTSMRAGAVLALVGALAGCGGSDGPDVGAVASGPAVSGAVVKGPVSGARVCAFTLAGGAKGLALPLAPTPGAGGSIEGACYVTPADGSYQFLLPAGTTGDVLIEASGGSFCADESVLSGGACPGGATPLALGATRMASVLSVPASGTATVYTTPLTTAAVGRAPQAGLSAAVFNAEFNTLAGQVIGPASGVTPSSRPTLALQPYLLQVSQFIQAGGTLGSAVSSLSQGTTTFQATPPGTPPTGTPPGNTSPATLNAALAGTHNLVFHNDGVGCGSRCSYTDGQALTFTVQGDGRLVLPGGTQLSNPFQRVFGTAPNTAEIIWLDAVAGVEYALSNNASGSFNEINVGDANAAGVGGVPGFLGQLRKPQPTGPAALVALAGTYRNALQYAGNHGLYGQWQTVVIGQDGSITFGDGTNPNLPSITASQIVNVNACIFACGTVRVNISRDINADNAITNEDAIVLHVDANAQLRSIAWDPGHPSVQADDVGIRVVPEPGPGLPVLTHTMAVPVADMISGTVGPSMFSRNIETTAIFPGTAVTLLAQDPTSGVGWRLQFPTADALNADNGCFVSPSVNRRIEVLLPDNTQLTTTNGGRCSITITERTMVDGEITRISGRFVAELLPRDKQSVAPKVVLDGTFSWTK